MKKIFLIFLIIINVPCTHFAQKIKTKAFYIELAGNCGFYSLNYEQKIHSMLNFRVGLSYTELFGEWLLFPIMINYYEPDKYISPEFGLGMLLGKIKEDNFVIKKNKNFVSYLTGTFGIRLHPKNKNLLIRFTVTPIYNIQDNKLGMSGGISLGVPF